MTPFDYGKLIYYLLFFFGLMMLMEGVRFYVGV